jgi:hypothetical protein
MPVADPTFLCLTKVSGGVNVADCGAMILNMWKEPIELEKPIPMKIFTPTSHSRFKDQSNMPEYTQQNVSLSNQYRLIFYEPRLD